MNASARAHLTKAHGLFGRGEHFYRKAAEEIEAALKADPTLDHRKVGAEFGRSKAWVQNLLSWASDPSTSRPTPYAGQAAAINLRKTKLVLRESSIEELAELLHSLPPDVLDRLDRVIYPRQRHTRRKVWVGPKRRLRVFRIVRDMLFDAEFVATECAEMETSDNDRAELIALIDGIIAHLDAAKEQLRRERRGDGKLVALSGGRKT